MTTVSPIDTSALRPRAQAERASASTNRWSVADVQALFEQPFMDLLFQAQQVHRQHFNPNEIQLSTLLSIKTGGRQRARQQTDGPGRGVASRP